MASLYGGVPYSRRAVPRDPAELSAWLATEFDNLSRRTAAASTRSVTAATTVLITDGMILCDTTGGAFSVTWPTPIRATKDWVVTIKRTSGGGANAVTIVGTVDGVVSPTLAAAYKAMTIWSDGTALYKIASI